MTMSKNKTRNVYSTFVHSQVGEDQGCFGSSIELSLNNQKDPEDISEYVYMRYCPEKRYPDLSTHWSLRPALYTEYLSTTADDSKLTRTVVASRKTRIDINRKRRNSHINASNSEASLERQVRRPAGNEPVYTGQRTGGRRTNYRNYRNKRETLHKKFKNLIPVESPEENELLEQSEIQDASLPIGNPKSKNTRIRTKSSRQIVVKSYVYRFENTIIENGSETSYCMFRNKKGVIKLEECGPVTPNIDQWFEIIEEVEDYEWSN